MFYVKKWTSSKTGKPISALIADLGYRTAIVSFDSMLLCDLLQISPVELFELHEGEYPIDMKGGE